MVTPIFPSTMAAGMAQDDPASAGTAPAAQLSAVLAFHAAHSQPSGGR